MDVTSPLLASKDCESIPLPDSKFWIKHVEPTDQLEDGSYNSNHVGHTSKNIVTQPIRVMGIPNIAVKEQGAEQILNVARGDRQVFQNAFLLVAKQIEKDSGQNCCGKDVPGNKMNKPHICHCPGSAALSQGIGPRSIDIEPGNTKSDDRQCKCPVIQSE